MKTPLPRLFLLFTLSWALAPALFAQNNRPLRLELRFGMNANLNNFNPFNQRNQKFPGLRIFGTAILNGDIKPWWSSSYAATVCVYNKSLGNNLNPLISDIQIDFVNTLSMGFGWKWQADGEGPFVGYPKYLRTVNNSPYYNLTHTYDNAFFFSSNFILNNHRRHQTVGSVTFTFDNFSVNYYNDGGPVIDWLNIGDGFDRYWTGGVMLSLHKRYAAYNIVEFSFDQFTGYRPLVYELSNIFGMAVPEYDSDTLESNLPPRNRFRFSSSSYNSSAYNLKFYIDENYGFDLGILGSLVYKGKTKKRQTATSGRSFNFREDRHWGLQDILHINRYNSLHPNSDINRLYIGFTYNQSYHVD